MEDGNTYGRIRHTVDPAAFLRPSAAVHPLERGR